MAFILLVNIDKIADFIDFKEYLNLTRKLFVAIKGSVKQAFFHGEFFQ